MKQLYLKNKMMKTISISVFAVATIVLVSGCGARPHYPQPQVFSNGVTYKPTWDGYNTCRPSDKYPPTAECRKTEDGDIVAVLQPDVDATMNSFLKTYSTLDNLCKYVNNIKLLPDAYSCHNNIRERLIKTNNYEKAYNWGLIDHKTWLLHDGKILEAYQAGFIDKDTARTEMLKHNQILEAYQAKLIDKDTADLYLKKQAMDNATRASQQQAAAIKAAAEETNRQNDMRAMDAQSNQFFQQQLQNSTNMMQQQQLLNQQNINNNMRKYY